MKTSPLSRFTRDCEGNSHVDLKLRHPGCFDFYVEYQPEGVPSPKKSKMHHFLMYPVLMLQGKALPYNGICMQTVIPKWLGPLSGWDAHLKLTSDAGYNFVHFAPLQQPGISSSPYSLFDQLSLADENFGKEVPMPKRFEVLKEHVALWEKEYGLLSLTDVVLNHTACNTPWLREHPEAGYNLINTPHLKPAAELDRGIATFSRDIIAHCGKDIIASEADLKHVINVFSTKFLPTLKLWEYFAIPVEPNAALFKEFLLSGQGECDNQPTETSFSSNIDTAAETLVTFAEGLENDRNGKRLDLKGVFSIFFTRVNRQDAIAVSDALHRMTKIIDTLNVDLYREYDDDLACIVQCLENTLRFKHLASHGPMKEKITLEHPILDPYFTIVTPPKKDDDPRHFVLANNGWIWGGDPLVDFASPLSKAYFRREVVPWSDSVKLRYGTKPDDSPWLWEHMSEYIRKMATIFHGFRIDNCHSTPLHVGQYLLDVARSVNPSIYIIAELFAGSADRDNTFVFTLGLHSLIREAMVAWDVHELSRQIHRSGGVPVASVATATDYLPKGTGDEGDGHFYEMQEYLPHAIFTDCTHDNESPSQKRTAEDALSTGALVAMSACAVGSNRGYDELFPRHLELPTTSGQYPKTSSEQGIMSVKKRLLRLHQTMAEKQYSEIHVHQDDTIIAVHRIQPGTSRGYLLIANTAFTSNQGNAPKVNTIRLSRTNIKVEFLAKIQVPKGQSPDLKDDQGSFRGLASKLEVFTSMEPAVQVVTSVDRTGEWKEFKFVDFPAGSILLLETTPDAAAAHAIDCLSSALNLSLQRNVGWYLDGISRHCPDAKVAVADLDMLSLNVLLYRCEEEERDLTGGSYGAYAVPNYGSLSYCGLQGFETPLKQICKTNDMGHPLFDNLRAGHWVMDYTVDRLYRHLGTFPQLKETIKWLELVFGFAKGLPNYLVPRYCTLIIRSLYYYATERAISQLSDFVQAGGPFTKALALGSIQLYGQIKSSSLHPSKDIPSLAAGFPHFATNYMRTWGRDTFIALRGLMITTGRFDVAKKHLHAFGSCLRHGLIPNLLDSGRSPRYNCRDAVWWYLQSVQDYCTLSSEGLSFLNTKMERRFPTDDPTPRDATAITLFAVKDLIQEVMERHARGIHFRECNAGVNLDSQMKDEGFQVDVTVDWAKTGFVFGGSAHNCGTWMDKMGESAKAGTKGVPATPRDGADIEIIGLLKSTLRWLGNIDFPHKGVTVNRNGEETMILYKDWDFMVSSSFEKYFFVPRDPKEDHHHVIRPEHVNRRGMYKDTYGSTSGWTDYQLRPNFLVAMVVAPELFSHENARHAISLAEKFLLGPLGMKTLDPSDFNYRGNYDNSNDSNDSHVAKGFNYHQGPEWVWCTGFFLRAYIRFMGSGKLEQALLNKVSRFMQAHRRKILLESRWAALPELTNENGSECRDSCQSQAWSFATLLDTLYDLYLIHLRVTV